MTTTERSTIRARACPSTVVIVAFCVALVAIAPALAAAAPPAASPPGYLGRPEVSEFIDEMVADSGFDARSLGRFFSRVRYQQSVVNAMSTPVLAPPKWHEYAPRFLNAARIDAGVAFWRANAATLKRAQAEFKVPAEVVVAIIGVETYYGRNTGSYRVADALTTLTFDYPRRAAFFREQLKQFLLLAREQGVSPLEAKGSYAGAQGLPQFMPGSVRDYAVDYDGDGRIDLAHDVDDAIGSVANYLARHGWQPGDPVMEPANIEDMRLAEVDAALDGGLSERRTMQSWQDQGVSGEGFPGLSRETPQVASHPPRTRRVAAVVEVDFPVAESVGVLMLEEATQPSYWIVFHNWYVLTRYNRSRLYASAVWQLAQELKLAFARE